MSAATVSATAAPKQRRGRAVAGWTIVGLVLLLASGIAVRVSPSTAMTESLDPEAFGQRGARALTELLRAEGVDVEVARDRDTAISLLEQHPGATLAVPAAGYLSGETLKALAERADRVVVLDGDGEALDAFGLGEWSAGRVPGSVGEPAGSSCGQLQFARVGEISPTEMYEPASGATGCFVGDDGAAAVLVDDRSGQHVALVGGIGLLDNEHLAQQGNAALGLALLGQTDRVVWYMPSLSDAVLDDGAEPQTLGELAPKWITPAILLLMLAGVAAGVWRGRRFGPLVEETLPVTVRASETMLGRARLYAKAADAEHAAEALRAGSVRRLGRLVGLGSAGAASAPQVADAVADRLGAQRQPIQTLLTGPLPHDDPGLIAFARSLETLEAALEAIAAPPGRNTRDS